MSHQYVIQEVLFMIRKKTKITLIGCLILRKLMYEKLEAAVTKVVES